VFGVTHFYGTAYPIKGRYLILPVFQTQLSVPVDKVSEELLSLLFAELSPVCAIVGGVLAQEVIKVKIHAKTTLDVIYFPKSSAVSKSFGP
jgi:predicted transcriptional regulator